MTLSSLAETACIKNFPFLKLIPSTNKLEVCQNFIVRIACLWNSNFLRTNSIKDTTGNFSIFNSSKSFLKKINVLAKQSVSKITWTFSKFQSWKNWLRKTQFFESRFSSRINLKKFKTSNSISCLKRQSFLWAKLFFEKKIEVFQSSKLEKRLGKTQFLENRFSLGMNLKTKLFLAKSVKEITWNISKFISSNNLLKKLDLSPTNSVYEITWNISKMHNSISLLAKFKLFENQFNSWFNLKYFKIKKARIICLKNWNFLLTDSIYDTAKKTSVFFSSKSFLKKLNIFANQLSPKQLEVSQSFRARKVGWEKLIFLKAGSVQ